MAHNGLNEFVKTLENKGLLIRIKEFVDPTYEIAEITDRISKQKDGGKALLFENVGKKFPVLTNAFGSIERMLLALEVKTLSDLSKEIDDYFYWLALPRRSLFDKLRLVVEKRSLNSWQPIPVSGRGECQQRVHLDPDLDSLPVLKSWPFDGGPSISNSLLHTASPTNSMRSIEICKMQVFSKNLAGLKLQTHNTAAKHFADYKKLGEHIPIAITLGGDSVYSYAAKLSLSSFLDVYSLTGLLKRRKVKLVKGITVDIEVPYDADIVIEGYIDPQEDLIWGGPFGGQSGFYALADWSYKFYVTCITHRRDAIYPAIIFGVPPTEDDYLLKVSECFLMGFLKNTILPEIEELHSPLMTANKSLSIVKIKKEYPGHANKLANALWGINQMLSNKVLVIVSSNVDIYDLKALALIISTLYNPLYDTFIGKGPNDLDDHACVKVGVGGKLLIDATEKLVEELVNKTAERSIDVETIAERLGDKDLHLFAFSAKLLAQGISALMVSIDKTKGLSSRIVASSLVRKLEEDLPKFIVFVDKEVRLDDVSFVAWYVSGNIDPTRDCFFIEVEGKPAPCLIIDGTRKSFSIDSFNRDWPNIVASNAETITKVNAKWERLGLGDFLESPSVSFTGIQYGNSASVK
ncbi:MAG: menaquinone biosynthesis decarboxylase [Bacteroidetes bacterium HGW-Bacteroidetes-15]|nr:MAG: menaquinone biosynthesis decarboxylase [Bacteroidetes bacterium HGW-Bacteroidetes-15]